MIKYPTLSVQDAFIVASGLTATNNTVPASWEIKGNLGPQDIMHAVQVIVDGHESLRTKIAQEDKGRFVQLVSSGGGVSEYIRYQNLERERNRKNVMSQMMGSLLEYRFDLTKAPLWRGFLARVGKGRHMLGIAFAHVLVDGYSVGVFSQDLANALRTGNPPKASQLGQIALAERNVQPTGAQVEYWRDQYAKRTPLNARWDGNSHYRVTPIPVIPPGLAGGVRELASKAGVRPATVCGAAVAIASAVVLGRPSPMLGFATAQRNEANQGVFGPLHDHLPVLGGAPKDVPFVDFVQGLHQRRTRSRDNRLPTRILGRIAKYTPYDIAVNFSPFADATEYPVGKRGESVTVRAIPTIGKVGVHRATSVTPAMAAILRPRDDGALTGDITAVAALHDEQEVTRVGRAFAAAIKAGVENPSAPIGELLRRK
jgi:hypothetical protein